MKGLIRIVNHSHHSGMVNYALFGFSTFTQFSLPMYKISSNFLMLELIEASLNTINRFEKLQFSIDYYVLSRWVLTLDYS